jgi:peptide chain release factor 3
VEGSPEAVEAFEAKNTDRLFRDADGDLAYLAMSEWRLDRTVENWPDLEFKRTKENTA